MLGLGLHLFQVAVRSGAGAASGGGAWTPANLGSALRAWYKFDILTGSNGDPQGSIADSSGNGFGLSQTTTLRPTLAVADQHGLNTLRFTASSIQRYNLSSSIFGAASAASAYLVYKVVSVVANNGLLNIGTAGNDAFPFSNGLYYEDFATTARKDSMTTTGNSSTAYRIISLYSAAGDWAFYMDGGTGGSSGGTSPVFQTATNAVGFTGAQQILGANGSLAALDGWIAEVVFTNAKQSTTDRQKVEGYLAHKWFGAGASNNLDSTHPYKNTPPSVGAAPQILISNRFQDENTAIGTTIGTLSVVGGTGTYTFTKTADPDSAFTLTSGVLKNAIVFDYEAASAHNVTIHADNGSGSTADRTLAIFVNDIDEVPPVITVSPSQTVAEGSAFSLTLSADKPVTWTKTGGADTALFTLTGATLSLPAQDYEDVHGPAYVVQVTATSTAFAVATNATITVTVTDVAGPTITSSATFSVAENSAFSTTLSASESSTFAKTGGADTALFTLSGATLSLPAQDYEAPADADLGNNYVVIVKATSIATGEVGAAFTITVNVTNVVETTNYLLLVDGTSRLNLLSGTGKLLIVGGALLGADLVDGSGNTLVDGSSNTLTAN